MRKYFNVQSRGVSLLEAVLYIALFSLLLTTALAAGFGSIDASARAGQAFESNFEADFLSQKLIEYSNSLSTIISPEQNNTSEFFSITRLQEPHSVSCVYDNSQKTVSCSENNQPAQILVRNIQNFQVKHGDQSLEITFTLNKQLYSLNLFPNL